MIDIIGQCLAALDGSQRVVLATVLKSTVTQVRPGMKLLVTEDGNIAGSLVGSPLEKDVVEDCRALMQRGESGRIARYGLNYGPHVQTAVELYLDVIRNQPKAVVVGAGHIGRYVAKIAKVVGFGVTVIDDRPDFANPELIPEADQVIAGDMAEVLLGMGIDRDSYVVLVTRGHKQDEATLRAVVDAPAAYIGMIGSRARVRTVMDRLIEDGFDRDRVESIHAPIGLRIGAESPEEIALSIVAEMVKVLRGGDAVSSSAGRVRRAASDSGLE